MLGSKKFKDSLAAAALCLDLLLTHKKTRSRHAIHFPLLWGNGRGGGGGGIYDKGNIHTLGLFISRRPFPPMAFSAGSVNHN